MDDLPDIMTESGDDSNTLVWPNAKAMKNPSQSTLEHKLGLIQQMLALKSPQVTSSMIDFLADEKTCEILIGFVTLVNPAEPGVDSEKENSDAQRVISLITIPSNPVLTFYNRCLRTIVRSAYQIFTESARGSFQNFMVIHNFIVRHMCAEYVKMIALERCFETLATRVANSSTISLVTILLQLKTDTPTTKKTLYQAFAESSMITSAFKIICSNGSTEEEIRLVFDLISRILPILSAEAVAEPVFQIVASNRELFSTLLNAATQMKEKRTNLQRQDCAALFLDIMQKSLKKPGADGPLIDPRQPTINHSQVLKEVVFQVARDGIRPILNALRDYDQKFSNGEIKFSGYQVTKVFSSYRIYLMDILCEILKQNHEDVLNVLDTEFWKLFIKWFFEYKNNNLYHCDFALLFETAILKEHHQSIEIIIKKGKFIQQLLVAFDEAQGNRGFVIKFCNIIRLANDAPGQYDIIKKFIISYPQWKDFIIKLRDETEKQTKQHFKIPANTTPVGFAAISSANQKTSPVQDGSIDLGSAFAKKLGFYADPPKQSGETEQTKKKKKKKNKKSRKKTGGANPTSPQTAQEDTADQENNEEEGDGEDDEDEAGEAH